MIRGIFQGMGNLMFWGVEESVREFKREQMGVVMEINSKNQEVGC